VTFAIAELLCVDKLLIELEFEVTLDVEFAVEEEFVEELFVMDEALLDAVVFDEKLLTPQ
jgi:hypothetical protein